MYFSAIVNYKSFSTCNTMKCTWNFSYWLVEIKSWSNFNTIYFLLVFVAIAVKCYVEVDRHWACRRQNKCINWISWCMFLSMESSRRSKLRQILLPLNLLLFIKLDRSKAENLCLLANHRSHIPEKSSYILAVIVVPTWSSLGLGWRSKEDP